MPPLLDSRISRYLLAAAGPVASAGAQFALSVVLLHSLGAKAFGAFSFLLVATQFGAGITGALFCAPLPLLMSMKDHAARGGDVRSLFAANGLAAVVSATVFLTAGLAVGVGWHASLLCAGFAASSSLRWFARTHAYALGFPLRTTASDITYSAALLLGVVAVWMAPQHALAAAFGALALSAVAGLLPFGGSYFRSQFADLRPRDLPGYLRIWRQHSGWSLLGVLTTEATANAHVYIVTFAFGATAFAPLAASALLIRPISVVINALTEFERAQMARQIGAGARGSAIGSLRVFQWALIATWVASASAAALLFLFAPRLLFPERYDLSVIAASAALWLAVAGVRAARTPHGVLLQAAGEFRVLAWASVISSVGSIAAVTALIWLKGPLWSIAGILFGELLIAAWIWRAVGTWIRGTGNAGNAPAKEHGSW